MLVVPFGARARCSASSSASPTRSEVADERLLAPLRALELGVPAELVGLAAMGGRGILLDARPRAGARAPAGRRPAPGRAPPRRSPRAPAGAPLGAQHRAGRPSSAPNSSARSSRCSPRIAARALRAAPAARRHRPPARPRSTCAPRRRRSAQGRGAIVMVPEIALTPQIVARFSERFGETVAVLHSRLTTGQRYAEWRRLREGEARDLRRPALGRVRPDRRARADRRRRGARGLLQARGRPPLRRARGRRRARPASGRRAAAGQRHAAPGERRCGCRPRCSRSARRRAAAAAGRGARHARRSASALHPATRAGARRGPRAQRGKAIVLLNRRGWSNFLSCRSCGRGLELPGMRRGARAAPRRAAFSPATTAGTASAAPARCPQCSSSAVARHGAGHRAARARARRASSTTAASRSSASTPTPSARRQPRRRRRGDPRRASRRPTAAC